MIIKITTIREFPKEEYMGYMAALIAGGVPIKAIKLLEDKKISFKNHDETTTVETTYEILSLEDY